MALVTKYFNNMRVGGYIGHRWVDIFEASD